MIDYYTQTLYYKARKGDTSILSDPDVAKFTKSDNLYTNIWQFTPLHWLARTGKLEILNHPDVNKVKDAYGSTPLYIFFKLHEIKISDLKKLFPKHKRKTKFEKKKVSMEEVIEILNTPKSVSYILED